MPARGRGGRVVRSQRSSRGEFKFSALVVGPRSRAKRCVRAFLCSANQRRDACGTGRYRDARELQQCDANAAILQPCRAQAARGFLHAAIAEHDCWRAESGKKASRGCGRARAAVGTHFLVCWSYQLGRDKTELRGCSGSRAINRSYPLEMAIRGLDTGLRRPLARRQRSTFKPEYV